MSDLIGEQRRIKFGVMCHGKDLRAWELACIEQLLSLDGVELALVILDGREPADLAAPRNRWLWPRHFLYDLYRRRYFRPAAMEPRDASSIYAGVDSLRCKVRSEGFSQYFSEEDVASIRAADLDFILRFGFNIIRGEVLHAARFGVWSFHHDDEERYRGQPACFWEIFKGDPVTGSILQRLEERLDAGVVLRRGYFKTILYSFVANRQQALTETTNWPASVCRDIQAGRTDYIDGTPSITTAPIFRRPTNVQMLKFAGSLLWRRAEADFMRRYVKPIWNVGVVRRPIASFLDQPELRDVTWYPREEKGAWIADPFSLAHGETRDVLVERFDLSAGRGAISALTLAEDGWREGAATSVELPIESHVSYPFLMEYHGSIYMIPEAYASGEVALFRAVLFPAKWEKAGTLIDNIQAVDPTLVWHDDRWWMFLSDHRRSLSSQSLLVYHARELLGPWVAHARNPVKLDVRSSRPAGTPFVHEGELYRPSQDCSRSYGRAIVINRVTQLTAAEFEEEPVATIGPERRARFSRGVHTLASIGDATLVDGKRYRLALRRTLSSESVAEG